MYTYNKIIFFISTLFISLYSFGTHVGGGFISYECTGNPREYRIRLTLYDDCNGTADVGPTQTVNFYNSCGIAVPNNLQETCNFFGCSGGATLNQISEQEVSQLCASELGNSYCNGGTLPGYMEHIYEGIVTLPADCDTWTIRYNLCCRNLADNATISTSNDDYYIETVMYTSTDDCNNSPQITAAPQPYVCVNQNVTYNLGAFETDGDNFTYELVDSRVDPTTTVDYNGGFSGAAPVNAAAIDPNTGVFTYTPSAQGTYIVAIKINEYDDNGDLISESIYDYQTVVIACTNESPNTNPIGIHNIAGPAVQNAPDDISLCFNESTCFDIEFEDVNGEDVLTVTSNLVDVFPTGTITYAGTNPIVATICFDVGAVELSNDITFLVQDDACPIYGQNNYTITINTIECDFCTVDLTADIVNCVTTPTLGYDIEGTVTFDDPPATGQLIIENCHGDQIIENLPLASPYDYSFTNVPAAGGDCEITATFTDDPTCTASATVVLETPTPVEAGPDQTICDDGTQVTLSGSDAITYTWDNGVSDGVAFTPATTTTYTVTGTDANGCETTDQLEVTVNVTPIVDAPADVAACDSYILPALTEGNYYTATNGGGTALLAGDEITITQTIYVYGETGTTPNCTDENSFTVTINTSPTVDAPTDVTACDSYILPALTDGNYFTATNGGGTALMAGDEITTNQTIYVYAETGTIPNCTAENSFTVTINTTPTVDATADVTVCDSYILPALTEGNYFTETAGGGTALMAGDEITTTQTIYMYAETGTTPNCTAENSFIVTINTTPAVDAPSDVTACDSYILPALSEGNYFTETAGGGTALMAGDEITTTQMIYVYAETGTTPNCTVENSFTITINPSPIADAPSDVTECDSYTLPALTEGNYFTATAGGGTALFAGDVITTTQTIYVYAETGTTPNCSDENTFVVTINPLPTVDAGPDQEICAGEEVTLNGSGGVTYTWDNGVTDGVAFAPAGTATYTVTGVDANSCENTDEVEVVVNPLPTVDAGPDQAICAGEEVSLNGSGAVTYTWDNGVTDGVIFSPSSTTTYTVIGVDANNCEDTDEVEVVVNPLPIIDAGPDQQLCEGEDVILEATGGLTYTWTPAISNGIAFTQDIGSETYAVVGVDQNGCQNTDEVMVSVFANPEVFAGNDLTICRGETVVLTATGAQDYEWNHGVVNGDPFIPGDTRTYTVTGLTSVGCQDVDSVEIIVIPIPNAEFTGENLFGCSPLTPVLTNTTAGDGYDNCTWYFGNGESLQGCDEVSLTFVETGCYDVSLTVSTPEGCSNTMTAPNFICVDPSPVAAFIANPTYLTSANPVADFTNQSTGATSYSWDFGDGSFPNTEEHPSHQYPDPTQSYTVTLTAYSEAGCPDTTSLDIDVEETLLFYVPNTFTPDNDNYGKINEVFKPIFTTGFDPFNYQLLIFNRWGELLFESNDTDFGWPGTYGVNGDVVKEDVYIWKIRFNRKADGEEEIHVGHVTLLK